MESMAETMKNKRDSSDDAKAQADQESYSDADAPPIEMSEEAAALVREIERERDEAVEARKRALADFQNYQRRASENERRALDEGMTRIVRSILPVLDHFDLAISQGKEPMTVEQLIGGVKIVRNELDKTLQAHGVERIAPEIGDEFDPQRHEAMMHEPSDEVEPGRIVKVYQTGYVMGDRVLRPAKVVVASPTSDEPGTEQRD
jgi:molecular chaperone GrpE